MPDDVAGLTASNIRDLMTVGVPSNSNSNGARESDDAKDGLMDLEPVDLDLQNTAALTRATGDSVDILESSWQEVLNEIIKTIKIVKDGSNNILKALIQTGKRLIELVITTVATAVKVLAQLLKLVGLTIIAVVDVIKYVMRWDEVLNTQMAMLGWITFVRENTHSFIEGNREKIVKRLDALKGSFSDVITQVIDTVTGRTNGEVPKYVTAAAGGAGARGGGGSVEYTFPLDLITTNSPKTTFTVPGMNVPVSGPIGAITRTLNVLDQALSLSTTTSTTSAYASLSSQIAGVKRDLGVRGIVTDTVVAILKLVQGVFGVLTDVASINADFTLRVLTALLDLFWTIMTLEIKVPVLSNLFKKLISGGRYELSVVGLATLGPAVVFTYAHMVLNRGKPPFPTSESSPSTLLDGFTGLTKLSPTMNTEFAIESTTESIIEKPFPSPSIPSLTSTDLVTPPLNRRQLTAPQIGTLILVAIFVIAVQVLLAVFNTAVTLITVFPVQVLVVLLVVAVVLEMTRK
ncbi:hypothetical protein HK102_006596 [Quaeritorhiza haematococci]|nr:hypothetical protein HK102_006596 [Quaeritorhiza haematococci]